MISEKTRYALRALLSSSRKAQARLFAWPGSLAARV